MTNPRPEMKRVFFNHAPGIHSNEISLEHANMCLSKHSEHGNGVLAIDNSGQTQDQKGLGRLCR